MDWDFPDKDTKWVQQNTWRERTRGTDTYILQTAELQKCVKSAFLTRRGTGVIKGIDRPSFNKLTNTNKSFLNPGLVTSKNEW
ncbi:hypothetical protein WA026_006951 [Henosepilachna vigintioctopunctata]|uniref:Uncharacterized protein n=1 Tax=Henosepilachna vigintioctopunctata TaxID=420089 RepID=A0AAW1VB81_9CUCU